MITRHNYLSLLLFATAGIATTASASGILREQTTTSYLATAGAGQAADIGASAAFNNPAGLAYLTRPEIEGNLLLIEDSFHFYDKGSNGTNDDFDSRRKNTDYGVGLSGGGSFFYGQPLAEGWGIGFALTSPAGGATDFGDNWAGSNFIESIEVMIAVAQVAVGYQISPQWSVGLSAGASYMSWELDLAPFPQASENLDLDDTKLAWALGLMYRPGENTRIGLRYVAGVDHEVTGPAIIETQMGNTEYRASQAFNLADLVTLSLDQQLSPNLTLLADIEWANWSEMKESRIIHEEGPTVVVPRDWKDAWGAAVGLAYKVSPTLALKIGVNYDESAVSTNNHKIDPPLDRTIAYSAGVDWALNDSTEFTLGYQYLDFGDIEVNQSIEGFNPITATPFSQQVIGESEAHVHIVSLGINKKF
ncbi:outer membrane protein transport protein [uncultured Shewanella sp.]|uniref:OmpP1/FadL family transporter n=1 Tax=uncultured Shewanella sp. TaxID=173975 RepID=UPI00262EDE87|nr:outer membrane protein transport protein [uncultured Shewanella sp.]